MTLLTYYERFTELELRHWEFCSAVRNNPTRHPDMGEVFLKEFFRLANPKIGLPREPRRGPDKSSIWYSADRSTMMLYFIGSYLRKQKGDCLSIIPKQRCEYLFPYVWYLLCLYYGRDAAKVGRDAVKTGGDIGDAGRGGDRNRPVRAVCYEFQDGNLMLPVEETQSRDKYMRYLLEESEYTEYRSPGARGLLRELIGAYRMFYQKAADHAGEKGKEKLDAAFCFELCGMLVYMADCLECHEVSYADVGCRDIGSADASYLSKLKYEDDPLLYLLCLSEIINPPRKIKCSDENLKAVDLEYTAEENLAVIRVSGELGGTEAGKRYVDRLKRVGNVIDIQVDVSIG
ncbi:MAG: hypothetical protein HDR26_00195 [Lachnospiraceae bacterium]|nr:hypothetical protein [Lachnospiraceae bacterium]